MVIPVGAGVCVSHRRVLLGFNQERFSERSSPSKATGSTPIAKATATYSSIAQSWAANESNMHKLEREDQVALTRARTEFIKACRSASPPASIRSGRRCGCLPNESTGSRVWMPSTNGSVTTPRRCGITPPPSGASSSSRGRRSAIPSGPETGRVARSVRPVDRLVALRRQLFPCGDGAAAIVDRSPLGQLSAGRRGSGGLRAGELPAGDQQLLDTVRRSARG